MAGTMFGEGLQQAPEVYKLQRDIERDAIENISLANRAAEETQRRLFSELLLKPRFQTEADKLFAERNTIDMDKLSQVWNPIKKQVGYTVEDVYSDISNLPKAKIQEMVDNPERAEEYFNKMIRGKIDKEIRKDQAVPPPASGAAIPLGFDSFHVGANPSGYSLGADLGEAPVSRGIASIDLQPPDVEQAQQVNNAMPFVQEGGIHLTNAESSLIGKMMEAEIVRGKSLAGLAKQGMDDETELKKAFMDSLKRFASDQMKPPKGGGKGKGKGDEDFYKKYLMKFGFKDDDYSKYISGTSGGEAMAQKMLLNSLQVKWGQMKEADPEAAEKFRKAVLSLNFGSSEVRADRARIFGAEAPGMKKVPGTPVSSATPEPGGSKMKETFKVLSDLQRAIDENKAKSGAKK